MPEIQSSIVEVTVFPDRARVTRRGTLELTPGTHRVEFPELPVSLLPDSVRASGRGTAAAALLGVDVRRTYFTESPSIPTQELEKQIQELNDQDRALADEEEAARLQSSLIKNLADQSAIQLARGLSRGQTEIGQGESLIGFIQQQLTQAQARAREVQRKRRELSQELDKLNREINERQSTRPHERYSAVVEVEVKTDGSLDVELTYMLDSASWQAMYDIRLVEDGPSVIQLSYLGQVIQHTGENWDNVSLTLSTARPALASIQPELHPWYLYTYVPVPLPAAAPRQTVLSMMSASPPAVSAEFGLADAMSAAPPPPVEMAAPEAQVRSEGASVTFKIAQPVIIPSDGTPHKVNVASFDFVPQMDYISVPKLAECAYRRAKVVNRSEFLLLAGQANLFVGGDFIGTMPLKQAAPNEEFQLTLGADDRIYVKRELKARDVDKKFLADRRRLRIGYEMEVRNLRSQPIKLELHDQFPVPQHEQIKVKLESIDPKPAEQSEMNELTWQLSLEPGAKRFIRFDFSIEHPSSMAVTGLP